MQSVTLQTYFSHSWLVIHFLQPHLQTNPNPKPFSSPKLVYCGFFFIQFYCAGSPILSTSGDALMVVCLWRILISWGTLKVLFWLLWWACLIDASHQFCTNYVQFPMEVWWLPFGLPFQLCKLISACLPQIQTRTHGKWEKKKLPIIQSRMVIGCSLLDYVNNAYFALLTYL